MEKAKEWVYKYKPQYRNIFSSVTKKIIEEWCLLGCYAVRLL
jgi:hypothetical protein